MGEIQDGCTMIKVFGRSQRHPPQAVYETATSASRSVRLSVLKGRRDLRDLAVALLAEVAVSDTAAATVVVSHNHSANSDDLSFKE